MGVGIVQAPGREGLPEWVGRSPVAEAVTLTLDKPSLADNTADLDRVTKALERMGYRPLGVAFRDLAPFARAIREADYAVTAVVVHTGTAWEAVRILPAREPAPVLGFAVDLGSSTIAFYLLDLAEGRILLRSSVPNPQRVFGADILTRLLYARKASNREAFRRMLVATANGAMREMCEMVGCRAEEIYAVSFAGNTVMSHFLLGLDPAHLYREPYIPMVNRFPIFRAGELGLESHASAPVFVFPNRGAYFGGDLLAGILAAGFHRTDDLRVLVDVGTNAEVVFGCRDWIAACAGAAGPALEGGVVERGMTAGEGAIERVRIDPESGSVTYAVIGGGPPKGICGSGLVDLVAEMVAAGLLTVDGKIDPAFPSPRVVSREGVAGFVVAPGPETVDGRDIVVTDLDIGIFLKSKAAMFTILNVMARKVGVTFGDIKEFLVAGAFGVRIDPSMAIRIGMLPDLPTETYVPVGNTAGRGACMVLLDRSLHAVLEDIFDKVTYIELNVDMDLMNEFRGALFLPHTDPRLFPSVHPPGGRS